MQRNVNSTLVGKPKRKRPFIRTRHRQEDKQILKKQDVGMWIGFIQLKTIQFATLSHEHGNLTR
jgi:hypothetical protein